MDSLKRVFRIPDTTWHSIIKSAACASLILNYRDVSEKTVRNFLTSHPRVESVVAVFKAESYVFGARIVDVTTAIVNLVPCTPVTSRRATLRNVQTTTSKIDDKKLSRRRSLDSGRVLDPSPSSSDYQSSDPEDLNVNEQDAFTGESPLTSDPSPLSPEVKAAVTQILVEYSNQQLLNQFRLKYRSITIQNVLSIPKHFIKCFSPSLKAAYFTLRRKAKKELHKIRTAHPPSTVQPQDLEPVQDTISPFARRMVEKMTAGEVVNTMFRFDYQSHRLLQRMSPEHQRLLRLLRLHRRVTPIYLLSNRSKIEVSNEAQFVAYTERLLKQAYPNEDLKRVDVDRLDATPLTYNGKYMVQVRRHRGQPTYEFCIEN